MATSPPRKSWRDESRGPGPEGRAKKASKQSRIATLFFFLLAIVGAVVALSCYLRPSENPQFRALALTQYNDPHYPPNPLAEQDSKALLGDALRWTGTNEFANQTFDRLSKSLAELKSVKDETLV